LLTKMGLRLYMICSKSYIYMIFIRCCI